jgi:predicted metal-binding protein
MNSKTKIGIIICDRYRRCAGGKCLRAMRNREGAFSIYADTEVELVGFTTCDGCPGGNIEYAGEEMVKNGAEVIHLATGLVVGYPPCPIWKHSLLFLKSATASRSLSVRTRYPKSISPCIPISGPGKVRHGNRLSHRP